ncbi:EAL domain-containing protein [Shewanella sp. C32]|uniref:EAL domain-containing protein n=1 Tax=Shewanella electrica TaxID=515560 RepID=A0ABT2FJ03_9GAMM|nr:EAL domain-containing protein [Shewanella electrica]MCH1924400.1 EAL domain-containing protein [Shewanella electrica]MCS4556301.1 EAL domain-containing protein [Shewanella electrica]
MTQGILLALVQNAALLLVLAIVYEAVPLRKSRQYKLAWRVLAGALIGGLAMAMMLTPWNVQPGIIYDARSILLCMTGLFFGVIPTVVAAVIATLYRLYLGGLGMWIGVMVIWSAALFGLGWRFWRHWRQVPLQDISVAEMLLVSFAVQVPIILCNLILPLELAMNVMFDLAVPFFTLFPLANAGLGYLLAQRLQHEQDQRIKLQDDFLFRSQFDSGNIGISIASVDMHWLKVNPSLCKILGYREAELLQMTWAELTHPEDLATDLQHYHQMMCGTIDGYELEKRFIHKNGDAVYCKITVSCKRVHGAVQLVIAGYINVTDAKLAEQQLKNSYQQLELVLASSGQGYWVWDIPTDKLMLDARSAEMLGCSEQALAEGGRQLWYSAIERADLPHVLAELERHFAGDSASFHCEYRFNRLDGVQRWFRVHGKVIERNEQGSAIKMCGVHEDITEHKQRESSLKLAASVYKNSTEAMAVVNDKGRIITINPAFSQITGYRETDILGHSIRLLRSVQHAAIDYRHIRAELKREKCWQGELWLKCRNNREIVVWLSINLLADDGAQAHRWVMLFSDITEKKNTEQVIWQQANYDPLTGLPNRRMFIEQLNQEIRQAQRRHAKFALLFLDLDFFKEVNDTLGHDMGDLLLRDTAERLRSCVRETDFVARLGGDEFTLLLLNAQSSKDVERVAQQILKRLAEPFQLGEENAYISGSIGITMFPDDGHNEELLLKHADQAMYAAKSQGRNRFNYFTSSMQLQAKYRMKLIQDLRAAVQADSFELCYQPIVNLTTNQVDKVEGLLRWSTAERGPVSPAEFIPVAEDTGMILDIGDWVFRQAVDQCARWQQRYQIDMQISINKSPIQFRDEGARFEQWLDYLKQKSVAGCCICIEITEGLLLEANETISNKLLTYRDIGIQVSLDDFGTGYSSLAYLKRFDIDYLKIDRSFTNQIDVDENNVTLCEAIIVMAHKLGIKVIAEGVENAEQAAILQRMGCDYAQGYFYSQAVTASQFEQQYLHRNSSISSS